METDPTDGKVTFMNVEMLGFKFRDLADIYLALGGLRKAAAQASEEAGHVVYPVWKLP